MNKGILGIIQLVWSAISGPMRDEIVDSVKKWEAKAKETKSPIDDIVVTVVKWGLLIP